MNLFLISYPAKSITLEVIVRSIDSYIPPMVKQSALIEHRCEEEGPASPHPPPPELRARLADFFCSQDINNAPRLIENPRVLTALAEVCSNCNMFSLLDILSQYHPANQEGFSNHSSVPSSLLPESDWQVSPSSRESRARSFGHQTMSCPTSVAEFNRGRYSLTYLPTSHTYTDPEVTPTILGTIRNN